MSDNGNVKEFESPAKKAIRKAKEEIDQEDMTKAVNQLTKKYRELKDAQVVVRNIEREIEDLEQSIEDGNN